MDKKQKAGILRILGFFGAILLGASIFLNIITHNMVFYIGITAGIFLIIFTVLLSRFTQKKQPDERYMTIQEKAAALTLTVLFLAGPIIICGMFLYGELFKIETLVKISNVLAIPLILLSLLYYCLLFYYRKKLGD